MKFMLLFSLSLASKISDLALAANVQSGCVEGIVFTAINDKQLTFSEAIRECELLNPNQDSELAAIRSRNQFNVAAELLGSNPLWIGIHDPDDRGSGTAKFEYVSFDQTGYKQFIDVGRGRFPWGENQPDNTDKNQNCITLREDPNDSFKPSLDDDFCRKSQRMMCSMICPTPNPTAFPTKAPTSSPSGSPTKSPTSSPSHSPTKSPTSDPTRGPSASPSAFPTSSPTTINSPLLNDEQLYLVKGTAWIIVALSLCFALDALKLKKKKLALIHMEGERKSVHSESELDYVSEYLSTLGRSSTTVILPAI